MKAKLCILALAALSSVGSVYAQAVNATLLGTVTDAGGGTVAGAKVIVTETATNVIRTVQTNDSGNYILPDLPPGTYSVTAEQAGFKKEEKTGVAVDVNSNTRVDLQLHPGDISQAIEVTGAPPPLQTDRADTGRTMDTQLVAELPLGVNRNFQSLLDLVPGTAPETFQHSQFFNASSSLQTNVNGQPRMGNNLQIEGIDNNERTGLLQILIPPAEAIQTVSVSVTNHDPELGRATGAVTNLILKSGTNSFHGSAYEFLQNSAFDARSYFNPSVGHLAYNYTGGTIGGPIKHNKLFFFADYLGIQDHEANTNQTSIPSAPFKAGDLSGDPTHQVYDPATGDPNTGIGRVPFPGNIIPQSRINPVSAKILALLPNPNENFAATSQTNDYFALLPAQKSNNEVDGKVDWNLSDKNRISGRFSFARPVTYQAPEFGTAGGPAQGAFEGTGTQKTYSSGLNYNRIINPSLLTEVRVGVAHYHNQAIQTDYGQNDSTAIGVPGVNLGPFTSGFVGIQINGGYSTPLTGYSASLPWDRAEANIDAVNSWTKIFRNHTIKWGVDLRRVRDDLLQDQTYSPRGIIYFGTNQTSIPGASTGLANDMASFLLDAPYQEGRDVNSYFPALRQWQVFSYVADNWQVTPKLTVNIGLRWEFYKPPTPAFPGGFSNYNYTNQALVLAGIGGNPLDMGLKSQYKYFAPRLGIAYRLDEKTVVRTGFGISYTPFPDNNWAYNFPVRSNNLYVAPSGLSYAVAALPGGGAPTFQNGFPAPDPVVVPANGIIANPNPTSSENLIPLNYKNGYIESWNLAMQRSLPWLLTLDVAYVGSHGVDTPTATNLNAGQIIGAGSKGQPLYPVTAAITQYFQGFSSFYNSLQVKFDRNWSGGFRMTTSFTWQKAMDFQGGDDGGLSFYAGQGLGRNYARADFDRTLNFIQSYIYQLPFGKGKRYLANNVAGKIVGGWQFAGVLSWRTGTPITVTDNNNLNLGSGGTSTADQVAPVQILEGINVGSSWFAKTSFAQHAGLQGNTGRNIFSGPDLFSLNGTLSRTVQATERIQVQLRLESFNLTNTPQFSNPNATTNNANYTYVTGTLGSGTGVNGTG
ncbi:MAG TPA: carboxypeptidase regulatory-like domain-containing protein, partial [Bryobacteraceae bacterium]|nr:carboxypeptidase regulatory-like domain-containing protein [Bryobacteraceae bacterium]